MHFDAVALAADELVCPAGVVGQAPVVGGRVGWVQGGQAGGDINPGAAGRHEADLADLHRTDGIPCVAGDHASNAQGTDLGCVQAVAGVHARARKGDRGRWVGGMESPVGGVGVARRQFAVGRDEGTCVHQQVVVFAEGEVGCRVDGDGVRYRVDSDQSAGDVDDDVRRGGVVVHQGEVLAGHGLHSLVKAEHQIGTAGDGPGGLAGDAQGCGVEAQSEGAAGHIALQANRVFYNGLEAVVGGAGAQAGGGKAPGARAQGGLAQTGAADGVIDGDALAGRYGAGVGATQGGGGVVAGVPIAQDSGGVAKIV